MNRVKTKATPGVLKQMGFTLIELSIVLVIIGLIVGGVLVGQDLIKAAEIRATISQYEKYNAAINTFRTKYNGIPGDLAAAQSTAFGLDPTAGAHAGTTGLGDGNGLITDTGGNATLSIGETLFFWQQLSAANLIDGSLGAALTTGGAVASDTTGSTISTYVPAAKLGRGNYWNAASASGLNYYVISAFGTTPIATAGTLSMANGLTPLESFNIDSKLDDGAPNTGTVQARGSIATGVVFNTLSASNNATWSNTTVANQDPADCIAGGAASGVSTDTSYARGAAGSGVNCRLRLRFN